MNRIKYGKPGRDEDLEKYGQMIRNCGELGIPMICYNFMPTGWYRTSVTVQERGCALTSEFDYQIAKSEPIKTDREYDTDEMWDNYTYFINSVLSEAQKSRVQLALHPDDPPVPRLHGVARIFISADAFRKAMRIGDNPYHGIAFCQATFKAMGENIMNLVEEFGKQKKLFFVHLRDIKGNREKFYETFHDNGPTPMPEMLKAYHQIGFDGPIRPDHTPNMVGDDTENPGYEMQGRLFAVGYMKGIMEALNIPVE
jgi:mannonate dehydratase